MTAIELRQKLIDQISRLSLQKLFFLEKLIQNLEKYFPEGSFEYSQSQSQSQSQSLDLPLLEDDPIIGMCSGKIPNLAERAEEILEQGIQPRSGWTWKE